MFEEQKIFIKNSAIKHSFKLNGKCLIYNDEEAKKYEKGGVNYKPNAYGHSKEYTHGYNYVLHFKEYKDEIVISVFVEDAVEVDEDGDFNYSTEVAFDKLSFFHSKILKDIENEYPEFSEENDVEMWGAGNRTAEMHIKLKDAK